MNGFMEKKVHRSWRQITVLILCSLGFTTLVSCYVTVENDRKYDIYGDVKGNVDGTEYALPDIVVQISNNKTNFKKVVITSPEGFYEFTGLEKGDYTLMFSDTDGVKNHGKFAQEKYGIGLTKDYHYSPVLELEKSK